MCTTLSCQTSKTRTSKTRMRGHFSWGCLLLSTLIWQSYQGPSSRNLNPVGVSNQLVERESMKKAERTNSGAPIHNSTWTLQSHRIWNSSWIKRVAGVSKVFLSASLWPKLNHQHNLHRLKSLEKETTVLVLLSHLLYRPTAWLTHRHSDRPWRKKKAVKTFQILNHRPWRTSWKESFKSCLMNGSKRPPTRVMKRPHFTNTTSQLRDHSLSSHRWSRRTSKSTSH